MYFDVSALPFWRSTLKQNDFEHENGCRSPPKAGWYAHYPAEPANSIDDWDYSVCATPPEIPCILIAGESFVRSL